MHLHAFCLSCFIIQGFCLNWIQPEMSPKINKQTAGRSSEKQNSKAVRLVKVGNLQVLFRRRCIIGTFWVWSFAAGVGVCTFHMSRWDVTKCHACHAPRGDATFETSKSDRFCRTRQRQGHSDLTGMVAKGCGRLRSVATRLANTPSTPRPPE